MMQHARMPTNLAVLAVLARTPGLTLPATAGPKPKSIPDGLRALSFFAGKCERLIIAGTDRTSSCETKMISSEFADTRSGFYFVLSEGPVLSFNGLRDAQRNPDSRTEVQRIDTIIYGHRGNEEKSQAVGTCEFGNPLSGPIRINCAATTSRGSYQGTFISDGKPPDIKQFSPNE